MSHNKMQNPKEVLANLRNSFNSGITRPLEYREKQLKNFIRLFDENTQVFLDALRDDLNKNTQESMVFEIDFVKNEILTLLYNLHDWTRPQSVEKELANIMDKAFLLSEPYGVVLIIGAWNYPIQVLLGPVAGAIAAGNCAIIKPSELAPATAKVIAELLPKYLDSNCYKVLLGGPTETQSILELKYDYIFYTGSTRVGGIVAQAAAKYLTPTTLELGGKSPCFVDSTVDMDIAAARIIWGKCVNAGQTCIAPDYILCTEETEKKFIESFKKVLKQQYGTDIKDSPDYGRIINSTHFKRLVGLLEGQEIAHGGSHDSSQRFIEPTICTNVDPNSRLMQEEIFGPVLPIVRTSNALEAINFINGREKPLALYVFSNDKKVVHLFEKLTSSGGICVNDTLMHAACDSLPFGGVGNSGIGGYHGKSSFDTFSHQKPILEKSIDKFGEMMQGAKYAPYNDNKLKMLTLLTRKRKMLIPRRHLMPTALVLLGLIFGYLFSIVFNRRVNC